MQIGLKSKTKNFNLEVNNCNFLKRFVGLMFSRRENAKILLFDFKKQTRIPIHSFFVFFSFVVVWLDDQNNIRDFKIVKPFSFSVSSNKFFNKLIEIPINDKNKNIIDDLKISRR